MDYFHRIQKVLIYIEDKLKEKMTIEELAGISYFSRFHFHRIFHAVVGDPVMEYIRKRRLARAAVDIIASNRRITDIALDYQFNTHDAFTRAFKRLYGISPDEYRKNRTQLTLFEKIDLMAQKELNKYRESNFIKHRIDIKSDFMVVGQEIFVSRQEFYDMVENPGSTANHKSETLAEQFFNDIKKTVPNKIDSNFDICYNYDCKDGYMSMSCIEVSSLENIPKGTVGKVIPKKMYVVFSKEFPVTPDIITAKDLEDKICKYAFGVWFPYSEYEPSDAYSFEVYDSSRIEEGVTKVEFYIPVMLRKSNL